ncbi:MAG: 1-deoxy-D-xylulose-5-phosphate synthase [Candidatus Cyclonatronum sp.]|uniref:1-deoxy-D-xylulose-5-phosphate synthase n=1 Tax=Cyclonatronum sp. TaxID=3024185 RepID=UPI0025C507E2|nr:1-deoxy-D-xylulose-5-phosphate synthase [Cyclonatronum sp.]MCH8487093.1 1-deoxy-D-xylulose-5-phosphate synthase [Cyclonatronum sp.]
MNLPEIKPGPLLAGINSPADLRKLSREQLDDVCFELRDYIIDIVSVHGGHFGASLGVVELTVALHYVLDTPHDRLVWDVGHQAYGHKILTGRRDNFYTNRKYKGLSGFPKRSESEYDTFGVGHSSTSISAALGMDVAAKMKGEKRTVMAVIGDGAMTGGMAFEALNHAGDIPNDITVILNDNNMSIDPNVGALKEYLADITTSKTFNRFRDDVYDMLGHFRSAGDKMRKVASKMEAALTSALTPGGLFRALGFKYYGPVDGHNVKGLVRHLEDLKHIPGPKLLHVVTVKGKGFAPAEKDQVKWHAQGSPFDKITGKSLAVKSTKPSLPKYQDIFTDAVIEMAKQDDRIVAVTPAMPSGTGLLKMMKEMPDRCYDVGIAEQHAVTFAAGLATEGKIPFAGIYSTFLQRGYDQALHDVALQKLPVVFAMDRAGLVGADGPTHHGLYDISYLRCVPNMVLCAPMNEQELRDMLYTATCYTDRSFGIRYPRGECTGAGFRPGFEQMPLGKGEQVRKGERVAVLSYGTIGNYVIEAAEKLSAMGIEISHYNMRFVKPLDTALLDEIAAAYEHVITIEDAAKQGGFGSAVAEYLCELPQRPRMTIMGVPDRLVEHGSQKQLHHEIGLDADGIIATVQKIVGEPVPTAR